IVADWIAARDLAEVEARFLEHNAAGIRVCDMADAAADPQYAARGSIVAVPDAALGEVLMTAPVPRMSATPGRIAHTGRALGADDETVLGRTAQAGR
ncbi:MAG: CoA transferase, partial [Conexibacter sp.]